MNVDVVRFATTVFLKYGTKKNKYKYKKNWHQLRFNPGKMKAILGIILRRKDVSGHASWLLYILKLYKITIYSFFLVAKPSGDKYFDRTGSFMSEFRLYLWVQQYKFAL